ncbi:IpaD/SipD/SspD family type III secretion system needle tip protein [Pseudomonas putida]|uniref:IpaD/SipD/SspD family type III secretion system needle tip protein n=1 Tax=Pseudomonas putida TaxID=303 RepID=UPI003D988372
MRINDFVPPVARPLADFSIGTDAPPPPEMPPEVPAGFSLMHLLERSVKTSNRHLENMLKCPLATPKVVEGGAGDGASQSFIAEFVEQLQAKRIRSQMWTQQMRQCFAVLAHCMATLPSEQRQQLENEQDRILRDLLGHPAPPEIADEYIAILTSSNDFFDKLLDLIDLIKNGYLAGYEHIIAAYSEFFKDFNAEITAKLKDWIEGANDGKEVTLNAGALRAALDSLLQKYSHPNPASVLFPKPGEGGASREEAEKWREALGLPASCLKQNADGSYCVVIDTGPLLTMKNSLPAGGTVTWDTAKFQAWQTGFNAQEEHMKNMLQSFTQKYSNANSYHDNFNKTLSSHLNQFADMLKAMLNF